MRTFFFILVFPAFIAAAQQSQQNTFAIPEANIKFSIAGDWDQSSKTGSLEQGRFQYSFTHPSVAGVAREVNPTIIVTIEPGSWFENEAEYVEEKWDFHRLMGDGITEYFAPDHDANPIESMAVHYAVGESGLDNNPYGQSLMLITFWNEALGFHMEIQTSRADLDLNPDGYKPFFRAIE